MARSKYDTNPLDRKVKEAADEKLGVADEEPRESAAGPIPEGGPPLLFPPYAAASAQASPDSESQPTARFPPSQASRAPGAETFPRGAAPPPSSQSNQNWRAAYAPPGPMISPTQRRSGLDIDANVEAGMSYFPLFGAIMALLVLAKEPRENRFARFHAMQALILHGTVLAARLLLSLFAKASLTAGARALLPLFSSVGSVVDLAALIGLIYLGVSAFKMRMLNLPVVGRLAEKYMGSL